MRTRSALAALATIVIIAAPAHAGDEGAVRRAIASAKEYLHATNPQFGQVRGQIVHAREYLDGLEPATKAALEKEIAEIEQSMPAIVTKYWHDDTLKRFNHWMESAKRSLEDLKTDGGKDTGAIRRPLSAAEGVITFDETPKKKKSYETEDPDGSKLPTLSDAERADCRKQIAAIDAECKTFEVTWDLERIERDLVECEDIVTGKKPDPHTAGGGAVALARGFDNITESLKKLPQDDPRVKEKLARIAKDRELLAKNVSQGAHDEAIEPCVKIYEYDKEQAAKEGAGWEQESTPPASAAEFFQKRTLDVEKTARRWVHYHDWHERDQVKAALKDYGSDPKLKQIDAEVTKVEEECAGKICKFANQALELVEKETPDAKKLEAAKWAIDGAIIHPVTHYTIGYKDHDATLKRAKDLLDKWTNAVEGQAQAKKDLIAKMTAAGAKAWPDFVSAFGKGEKLDATDAVKNPGSWKGKYFVAEKENHNPGWNWNRSGWNYMDEFAFIVPVNGVPVCGSYDDEIRGDLFKQIESATGLTWYSDGTDTDGVIGVIEGTCVVHERIHNPLNNNEMIQGRAMEGVKIRIVALWAGPFAAACGHGTCLDKMDKKDIVKVASPSVADPRGSHSSSGSSSSSSRHHGGFATLILRLMSWFESFMAFLGGLAAILYGAAKFVPQIQEQRVKAGKYVGYAGFAFAGFGLLWLLYTAIIFDFFPASALLFAGSIVALDHFRMSGKIPEETAAKIAPIGIVLGLGAWLFGLLHLFCWDFMLL